MQDRQISKLKTVGHIQINTAGYLKLWPTTTPGQFAGMARFFYGTASHPDAIL